MPRFRLFYHFVWATKLRLPLITDTNREAIFGSIIARTEALGGVAHAINGMPDHLHVFATIPPSIALAKYVNEVKGVSSHLANHLASSQSDHSFKWQDTYGVTTVSESHAPTVVRYVNDQQKHHAPGGSLDKRLEEDN
jgi:putative transposase